jgi:UDP-N-acetylmuramoyl-tripeptide--D-alanyl-D-alanine ligase
VRDVATPVPANSAPLTAWSAAAATGGKILSVRAPQRGGEVVARGITSDSRAVSPGCAFVALRGERYDGHDYVDAAIQAGAALVVVERGRIVRPVRSFSASPPLDIVEVDDTLVAWGDLARAHVRAWRRGRKDASVFAITGSAGKTTTKELAAALLRAVGPCHATAGNLNNRVGVPAVAFGLEPHHRFAVFEVGMSSRGEIGALARVIEADIAILTNISIAHAEGVGGTRADVAREKGDLFAALPESGVAVACFDDPAAMGQLGRTRARQARSFGLGDGADYRLEQRTAVGIGGARLDIKRLHEGTRASVWLGMPGEAAAIDLTGALAAVEAVVGSLGDDAISAALEAPRAHPPGRMQVRQFADGATVLDDTYNANPESVRAALRTLAEVAGGRRAVVILGEMRELGSSAPDEHAALGAAIAEAGARLAVSCGGLADLAILAAEKIGVVASRAVDAAGAAAVAASQVRAGDVVLVKASRAVGAERVVEALARAHGGEVEQH